MRYVTDVLKRYQSGFGFSGAAAANLEGVVNRGIFTAGIAYNEKLLSKQQRKKRDYKVELYSNEYTFADMELVYGDRRLKFGFGSLVSGDGSVFAPPPLISFKRSKNVGITVIDERDEAEIVENFSINSWDIDMKGLIIDLDEHAYPQSRLKDFRKFFEINDVIEVHSALFNDLGIHSLWFKEQDVEPLPAFPDTIKYSIVAKSIKPAEFSIIYG